MTDEERLEEIERRFRWARELLDQDQEETRRFFAKYPHARKGLVRSALGQILMIQERLDAKPLVEQLYEREAAEIAAGSKRHAWRDEWYDDFGEMLPPDERRRVIDRQIEQGMSLR